MNYRLSTYADRVHGKRGFVLIGERGGVVVEKITKFEGDNIKENALECISQGLSAVKNIVAHEDLLLIEVQNCHLCRWLDGSIENKSYSAGLDKVFAQIESIDCRYRYSMVAKPLAKFYMAGKDFTKLETVGVDDLMAEFEEGEGDSGI